VAAASKRSADAGWAHKAQELLGVHDAAQQRTELEAALVAAKHSAATSNEFPGLWWYHMGTIQFALGHKNEARDAFRQSLLLPDSMMSHHFSRVAIRELDGSK